MNPWFPSDFRGMQDNLRTERLECLPTGHFLLVPDRCQGGKIGEWIKDCLTNIGDRSILYTSDYGVKPARVGAFGEILSEPHKCVNQCFKRATESSDHCLRQEPFVLKKGDRTSRRGTNMAYSCPGTWTSFPDCFPQSTFVPCKGMIEQRSCQTEVKWARVTMTRARVTSRDAAWGRAATTASPVRPGAELHSLTYQVILRHLAKLRDGAHAVLDLSHSQGPAGEETLDIALSEKGAAAPTEPEPRLPLAADRAAHRMRVGRALVQIRALNPDQKQAADLPAEIRDQIAIKERTIGDIVARSCTSGPPPSPAPRRMSSTTSSRAGSGECFAWPTSSASTPTTRNILFT